MLYSKQALDNKIKKAHNASDALILEAKIGPVQYCTFENHLKFERQERSVFDFKHNTLQPSQRFVF